MPTYAQAADVQARMVRIPTGAANTLTTENLDLLIEQIEGEIEMVLAGRDVFVPVTTPSWFISRLRSLACDGAAALAMKAVFPEVQGPGSSPAYAYFETRYRQGLIQLQRMTLPSSVVTAGATLDVTTYFTRNPDLPATYGENATGLFDVDKVL